MHRKEREAILGEFGLRDPTERERAQQALLEQDLQGSPLRGKPLERRLRNFRPGVDVYVAALGGPLPYMRRLRQIELETEEHERRLAAAWLELAESCTGDAERFAVEWSRVAARQRFDAVNELIRRHNLYYPAEARLPMDVRSGDFVLVGGRPYRREPLDAGWVLELFPPDLGAALGRAAYAAYGGQAPSSGFAPYGPDACQLRPSALVSTQ